MMKKIINPFDLMSEKGEYNCFGCSPANDSGLHLQFWEDNDELMAKWKPGNEFEGWKDILHGGIQAALMDEMAAWVVFIKMKTAGVTSRMDIRYLKPVFISKGEIMIRGRLIRTKKQMAIIGATLHDGEGTACAEAIVTYFCFPEKIAKAKYQYPGADAFYP